MPGPAVARRPLVSAQPGCQVADGDGENEDADGAADHGLGQAGLEAGAGVGAGQPPDAQGDAGGPVGGHRGVLLESQRGECGHASHRGREGGSERGRGDLAGRVPGRDQDGREDGAAANAVNTADAADQAGQGGQDQAGDLPGRDRPGRQARRAADSEPGAQGQQDGGDDEGEDAGAGEQFDADDRSGDDARQGPGGELAGQPPSGLVLAPVPVQGAGGGDDVVEQVGGGDGRAGGAQHADLERQQQDGTGDTCRGGYRRDGVGGGQGDEFFPARTGHTGTLMLPRVPPIVADWQVCAGQT